MAASSAIDKAIAKLDAILAGVAASASAAQVPAASTAAAAAKPAKAAASKPATPAAAAAGDPTAFQAKVQIKVARILSAVPQPNSEKLLKLSADLGAGDTRQIMAGLQQYLKPEDLVGKLLCVVSNLKPAKLAGEPSEAMVLAAEGTGSGGEAIVRALVPPEGSQPGDPVHLDGASPVANPKVLKLDEWRKVSPGLVVAGGHATYGGTALMTARGYVTLPPEITDGCEIH
ncbi:methionyl-tRNA synthetase [Monoraphidium neglectum]|uniref:Methionyl-tRNA synthetase n=1 Tax=Monoraphidium neglectum TaxID=145388 RepID=A0A0D2LFY9_9CHLO|nr:methionyl-tRNA synthetase [Monoraphidium neglectum]KIZ05494.1 methionyl-tRNA synthetase [Monoraphidium neglectum]|eukprot:XP_013904513.1 methionyl-tRNA synthetase [Monoraphidium neglectum]